MMQFGAQVDISTDTDGAQWISVEGQTDLDAQEVVIPGDPFLTSCAVVAGLVVSNSELTIKNVHLCPMQTGFFDALLDMGANLTITGRGRSAGQPVGDLRVRSSRLIGTSVPVSRSLSMGDHYTLLAVAASFAEGKTIMPVLNEPGTGKSTRMVSIFDGLQANGVACNMEEASLRITGTGRVSGAGTVNAGNDVHVAMALLIMGMAADAPIKIDDAGMINNTCPEFIPFMRSIGANLE